MKEGIEVENLTKSFNTKVKRAGFLGALRGLISSEKKKVVAVGNISFSIKKGELVGFIGPNGAGKSTTIKMLSGILFPDKGKIEVLGLNPQKERIKLAYRIGTIFGQKQQLWYHLPPIDSFDLLSNIYELKKEDYRKRLNELVTLFEIEPYLHTPVRKLSLGERMRCEFVASLLHKPEVLFLDEPTIGMDIIAKKTMRDFIKKINAKEKTTIILTSHDFDDIEALCDRIIIINKGSILYDGSLDKVGGKLNYKRLTFYLNEEVKNLPLIKNTKVIKKDKYKIVLDVDKSKIELKSVIDTYFTKLKVADIDIEDIPVDEVIEQFYKK